MKHKQISIFSIEHYSFEAIASMLSIERIFMATILHMNENATPNGHTVYTRRTNKCNRKDRAATQLSS